MVTTLAIEEIISDPQVRGGRPVVAGTGLCVSDLVAWRKSEGISIEELARGFGLSLGQIYAAFAYYYLHQAKIDAEIQENAAEAENLRAELAEQGKILVVE